MTSWQLQEAKAKLSELVKRAATEGPQEITVHGQAAAVLVSADEFARLMREKATEPNWLEVLQRAQLEDGELIIERDKDATDRDIGL